MNNNSGQQKRIILAVAISFLFFIFYTEFFVKDNMQTSDIDNQTKQNQTIQNTIKDNNQQAPITNKNQKLKTLVHINSEHFKAQIDTLGRISSFILIDNKFKDQDGKDLELIQNEDGKPLPLELRFVDELINNKAFNTSYTSNVSNVNINTDSKSQIILTQKLDDIIITKYITFYNQGNYEIKVEINKKLKYFISPGSRPSIAVDAYTVHGGLILDNEDTIETFEDGDVEENVELNNIYLASSFDRYYSTLFYNFSKPLNIFVTKDSKGDTIMYSLVDNEMFEANGYIGAKEYDILYNIDKRLINAIEYGWFTFIAKPMFVFLKLLYGFLGNWGWSIIVLTIIIRLILFPLTYKSMISMNKLKELAPKMTELRQKYKSDPQKLNIHMMELYKKHGANPFSGCLPIFLQIPIFFAIYRVLQNAVELKAAPWALWIHDLSVLDPYYVLPILMGATMFLQQVITPMSIQDPTQAKIMKFLPIVFTFFFLWFPAGLTLYWCVNNIFSLIQQYIINKIFAAKKQEIKL